MKLKFRKYAGLIFFRTLFFIQKIFCKKKPHKYILAINYNNLGDLVCDTPSLRSLKKSNKNIKILILVRNQACVKFMKLCPYVDEILEMPHSKDSLMQNYIFAKTLKKYNFIYSIQFVRPFYEINRTYLPYLMNIKKRYGLIQKGFEKLYKKSFTNPFFLNNTTTRTEESAQLVKLTGTKIDSFETECWIDQNQISEFKYKNYIIIQTCATMQCRMWHSSKFVELIKKIQQEYPKMTILLTGTNKEYPYIKNIYQKCRNNKLKILCNLNISTLLNYIKHTKLLITNDTGPFHFALAFKKPIIALFGISPPEYLISKKDKNVVCLRGGKKCNKNCKVNRIMINCKQIYKQNNDEINCINNINVKNVMEKIKKFL